MSIVHNLRGHLLPDVDLLHEAGGDSGPADRPEVQGAAGGAADVHQRQHRRVHPGLGPAFRPPCAALHAAAVGHHHDVADRRWPGPVSDRRGALRARGDEAAPRREGCRPSERPEGDAPDESVVDSPAVQNSLLGLLFL
jgi:hypothetical protein